MPQLPTFKHARLAITHAQHVQNIIGVNVTVSVPQTAHSVYPFLRTTTAPMSAGWLIQTFAYSYDGVIHVDSYRSDI